MVETDDEQRVCKLALRHYSNITSLPPSIGCLKNLKILDLSLTEKLVNLPEEIGDLTSLKKLDLKGSKITLLPPSISRLKNLE